MFTEDEEMKVELAERLRTLPSATFSYSGTQGHNGAQQGQGLLYRHQSGHGKWQSDTERGLVFHPDTANCLKDLRQIFNLVK